MATLRIILFLSAAAMFQQSVVADDYVPVCQGGQCRLVKVNVSSRDTGLKLVTSNPPIVTTPALLRIETLQDMPVVCADCGATQFLKVVEVASSEPVAVAGASYSELPLRWRLANSRPVRFARRVLSRALFWR